MYKKDSINREHKYNAIDFPWRGCLLLVLLDFPGYLCFLRFLGKKYTYSCEHKRLVEYLQMRVHLIFARVQFTWQEKAILFQKALAAVKCSGNFFVSKIRKQ